MDDTLKKIVNCIGPKHGAKKELAEHLGIHPNVITNWLNGRNKSYKRYLPEIARYFNVPLEYLSENPEDKEKAPALTDKDERDIARDVERIMSNLETSGDLMFDGVPMSQEAKESMAAAMKLGLEAARLKNKETYTPKKYKKE
ncbi:helix-turn-helix domain-containing protein [Angelakisella massiliensis]|uniref:helix-turn-helix domain-containing protein n=1 Tax=Angelakisella massiliensis TaxID=1871018 RepID=UPI0008F8DDFE|nr:helix-turn-helix transcriptional regulator [Angelakisella massiliensis]